MQYQKSYEELDGQSLNSLQSFSNVSQMWLRESDVLTRGETRFSAWIVCPCVVDTTCEDGCPFTPPANGQQTVASVY